MKYIKLKMVEYNVHVCRSLHDLIYPVEACLGCEDVWIVHVVEKSISP